MKIFDHTRHKELWTWLTNNLSKEKKDFPYFKRKNIINYCFACEYTKNDFVDCDCTKCPLIWETPNCFSNYNSLYNIWDEISDCFIWYNHYNSYIEEEDAIDYCILFNREEKILKDLANQICNLPVRVGVKTNDIF